MRTIFSSASPRALAVAAVVGTLAALIAVGLANSFPPAAASADTTATAASMSKGFETSKMLAFHDKMRSLWQVHGTFTERAIVDAVGGLPDTPEVIAHLQRNQVDIGNAVKPYYGAKAGHELTKLLHRHISDAVSCVVAAKAGETTKLRAAENAFYANGNQIASFLHSANPHNWSLKAMRTMMRIHLNQVLGLAVDQIKRHYNAAIKLYGAYINHLQIGMADMLSDGIMKQFPAKFR
jgi:hypothetical protein